MKRDIQLIIKILEYLEQRTYSSHIELVPLEGYSEAEVGYHQILCADAGLVFCEKVVSKTTPDRIIRAIPFDLTWKGQEFLAATRQKAVWKQVQNHFGKNLREAPVDTVFDLATRLTRGYAERKIAPLLGMGMDDI